MYRVVWLFPHPVRTAQTATTGTRASSIVSCGPRRTKFAPAARTSLALCITYSWLTSEYAKTTSSTSSFSISDVSSLSS